MENQEFMMSSHIICSCYGVVEEVSIKLDSRIYEWDELFTIITFNDRIETVRVGLSGKVHSLDVQKGDQVKPGMILACIKEDLIVSGSD